MLSTVHIITRLDRDTSGIMFLAKHCYAHALMNQHKFRDKMEKRYFAIVNDRDLPDSGRIDLPIVRRDDSIIQRQVRFDEKSKDALTSYVVAERKKDLAPLDIILHTVRTDQIGVHFSHLGYPLIGNDLYGGNHDLISCQILHCHHLQFLNPFADEIVHVELDMPEDVKNFLFIKISSF